MSDWPKSHRNNITYYLISIRLFFLVIVNQFEVVGGVHGLNGCSRDGTSTAALQASYIISGATIAVINSCNDLDEKTLCDFNRPLSNFRTSPNDSNTQSHLLDENRDDPLENSYHDRV
uniref:Uncharacterized protein n=1 Tax=Romanomermis culicivorax TaxID=13658 RepID=A0A915HML7_ROMCU